MITKKWWGLIVEESGWKKYLNNKIQTPNQCLWGPSTSAHCFSKLLTCQPYLAFLAFSTLTLQFLKQAILSTATGPFHFRFSLQHSSIGSSHSNIPGFNGVPPQFFSSQRSCSSNTINVLKVVSFLLSPFPGSYSVFFSFLFFLALSSAWNYAL